MSLDVNDYKGKLLSQGLHDVVNKPPKIIIR